jgi:hypothetical protein
MSALADGGTAAVAALPGEGAPSTARRVRALVGVLLAEGLRRGRSAEGTEVRPLRQVLFASTLLGVFCAVPLRHQAAEYWVQALCLYAALYTALAVMPDPQDAFERRRDLLAPLPLRPLEAALARVSFLGLLVALLVVPLGLPSVLWMTVRGLLAPWQAPGVLLALLLVSLTITGTWLYFAFLVGRLLGVERMRRIAGLLMSLLVAGTSIAGSMGMWGMGGLPRGAAGDLIAASPTSWAASPLFAPGLAASWWRAAGALALAVMGALLAARTDPTVAYTGGRPARAQGDGSAAASPGCCTAAGAPPSAGCCRSCCSSRGPGAATPSPPCGCAPSRCPRSCCSPSSCSGGRGRWRCRSPSRRSASWLSPTAPSTSR